MLLPDVVKEACLRGRFARLGDCVWIGKVSAKMQATVAGVLVLMEEDSMAELMDPDSRVFHLRLNHGVTLSKRIWYWKEELRITYKVRHLCADRMYMFDWVKLPPAKNPIIVRFSPFKQWIHSYTPQGEDG